MLWCIVTSCHILSCLVTFCHVLSQWEIPRSSIQLQDRLGAGQVTYTLACVYAWLRASFVRLYFLPCLELLLHCKPSFSHSVLNCSLARFGEPCGTVSTTSVLNTCCTSRPVGARLYHRCCQDPEAGLDVQPRVLEGSSRHEEAQAPQADPALCGKRMLGLDKE